MDSRTRGLICDLNLGVGQRLPCWIPNDADNATRARGLGVRPTAKHRVRGLPPRTDRIARQNKARS